jgi:hypothetical protein
VKDLIAERDEEDVRRALARTRQARPPDVLAWFRRELGGRVAAAPPAPAAGPDGVPPLDPITDEPY